MKFLRRWFGRKKVAQYLGWTVTPSNTTTTSNYLTLNETRQQMKLPPNQHNITLTVDSQGRVIKNELVARAKPPTSPSSPPKTTKPKTQPRAKTATSTPKRKPRSKPTSSKASSDRSAAPSAKKRSSGTARGRGPANGKNA